LKWSGTGTNLTGTLTAPAGGMRRGGGAPDAAPDAAPAAPPAPTPVAIVNGGYVASTKTVSFDAPRGGRGGAAAGGPAPMVHYSGVVSDDVKTITGTMTMPPRGGEGDPMSVPWTATKQATP
jgi:hypothetical protein